MSFHATKAVLLLTFAKPPSLNHARVTFWLRLCVVWGVAVTAAVPVSAAAQAAGSGMVINEILAINQGSVTGIVDDDGDSSDFIELHNTASTTADVSGWALVDGDDIWEFPAGTQLGPGGYLLVWASGKDRVAAGHLHASFKLRDGGEFLGLFDDDGKLISSIGDPYPDQHANISYGMSLAGVSGVMFTSPTPGSANSNVSVVGKVASPDAAAGRGFYAAGLTETLSTTTIGAEIRYTTDGTPPTQVSTRYAAPLTINPDRSGIVTVRARAFKAGWEPSDEASWSYVFAGALYRGLAAAGIESLPVVVVNTDDQLYPTDLDRSSVAIEMVETDPDKPGFAVTAGVKEFGETSVQFEKSNLRVFFESEFGPTSLEYPVFDGYGQGLIEPAAAFDKLELRGGSWDSWQAAAGGRFSPSDYYLSDRFIRDIRLDMGTLTPHGRFVTVFVNGDFRGLYQLRERFDHTFYESYAKDGEEAETFEAIKVNDGRYSNNGDQNVNGDGSVFESLSMNWQADKDIVDAEALVDFVLVMSLADDDFEREYRGVGSMDPASPNDYVFLHNDNDMRLRPVSRVLGNRLGYAPGFYVPPLIPHFEAYRDDPEFRQIAHERAANALCPGGALTLASMHERLDFWVDEIDLAMRSEDARWDGVESVDISGSTYIEDKYGSWQDNIADLRTRVTQRHGDLAEAWTSEGLFVGCDRRPVVDVVDQTDPVGVGVEWKVPASDPDFDTMTFAAVGLPPGLSIDESTGVVSGVSTTPGIYDVGITVTDARGRWTPVSLRWEVVAGVDLRGLLVINEVMYNPNDQAVPLPVDPDLASFVEVLNVTDGALPMTGVHFGDGVDYRFPDEAVLEAGSTWVVAESAAAFRRTFGRAADGIYDGGLSNSGERLAIHDRFDRIIDVVEFDDDAPWPAAPDGMAGSLSLVDPSLDNNVAASWRVSPTLLGSPGATNVVFDSGDVNGSGTVDDADVVALLIHVAGVVDDEPFYVGTADVDDDGSVSLVDAIVLARRVQ